LCFYFQLVSKFTLVSKFIVLISRKFKTLFLKVVSILLICIAYMQGELNVFSMYIYIFIVWFVFTPLLMNWQKEGEEFREFIYACLFCMIIFLLMQKGKKNLIYASMLLFRLCISLHIYLFIAMHELRGSFYEAYL